MLLLRQRAFMLDVATLALAATLFMPSRHAFAVILRFSARHMLITLRHYAFATPYAML